MATFVGEEEKQQRLYDVIIVGAGISGLCTNHTLVNKFGVAPENILVLEAQDYIGGRIRQAEDFVPNGLIELGAEILHGEETLLTQFGREIQEPMKSLYVWAHGDGGPMEKPVDRHYGLYYFAGSDRLLRFDADDDAFQHMNEVLAKIAEYNEDDFPLETTLEEYLRQQGCDEEMVSMGNAGFANTLCTKSNKLALRQVIRWGHQWDTEGEVDGDFKFKSTFRCIINLFKKSLYEPNVLLNTPVRTIERHSSDLVTEESPKGLVRVHTCDGRTFRARSVVVTSSIYVLQHPEVLSFEPPLPETHKQALQTVVMNRAMKIFARFSAPFWPIGLQGMIMAPPADEASDVSSHFIPECWFNALPCALHEALYTHEDASARKHPEPTCPHCSYYVTGFCTSDFAGNLDDSFEHDEDICQVMLSQLDRVFHKLAPEHHLRSDEYVNDSDNETADEGRSTLSVPSFPLPSEVFMRGKVQRWTPRRHPYIGGGYASGLPVHQAEHCTHNLTPGDYASVFGAKGVDDLVYFAGEGVNFPAGATAHAALESAIRAATNVATVNLGRRNSEVN